MSKKRQSAIAPVLAIALACVGMPTKPAAAQSGLQFRELYSEARVVVSMNGRTVRSYTGATGGVIRAFGEGAAGRGPNMFLLRISTGGNACLPMLAVLDAGRSPAFASDVFGSCEPDIVVGHRNHLALSVRSDGRAPDDVWFYDGRALQRLPRLSREEHVRRGEAAAAAGRHVEAVRQFLAVADHGDPRGPFGLAALARDGLGIEPDPNLARDLFERAADIGHVPAMVALAIILRAGGNETSDPEAAIRWLRRAAARGDGGARLVLGRVLAADPVTSGGPDEALVWLRLAEASLTASGIAAEAAAARGEAERLAEGLGEARTVAAAVRTSAFRPTPPGPVWDFPTDWAMWDRRHPLQRVRGSTLFEIPQFGAPIRGLVGPRLYGQLAIMSGPASVAVDADWVVASGCRAHFCNSEQYILALRRDGADVALCILQTPEPPPSSQVQGAPGLLASGARRVGQVTFARLGSPQRVQEDVSGRGCPTSREDLLRAAPMPLVASRGGRAADRDAPMPRPSTPASAPGLAAPNRASPAPPPTVSRTSSGTAWHAGSGLFVTNAHVVEGCAAVQLSLNGQLSPMRVAARSGADDLAVLAVMDAASPAIPLPPALPLRLNPAPRAAEPVVVAGFPLRGVLAAGPQVSTGIVTALAGLRDDPTRIQISAPIQPGNSGGPVLDRQGRVIGVASATLGTLAAAAATGGALPQNVNFAIRAERAAALLASVPEWSEGGSGAGGLSPSALPSSSPVEEVAARALAAVALAECRR